MSNEWNGEGLPPAGAACEAWGLGASEWDFFDVVAVANGIVFGFWSSKEPAALNSELWRFRKLSTEAERNRNDRIGTINSFIDGFMKSSKGDHSNLAAALHDYLSLIDRLK